MPVKNCNIVEKLGKTGRGIYVQVFNGKTRTNNKPKTKGNKDGQTYNHYIQQLTNN